MSDIVVKESNTPFFDMMNYMEEHKYQWLDYNSEEDRKILTEMSVYFRLAFYEDGSYPDRPFPYEKFKNAFEMFNVPYIPVTKKDGGKENTELIHFRDIVREHPDQNIMINKLIRYLEEFEKSGGCFEEYNFLRYRASITVLYNNAFGPFYPKNPDHQYRLEELNMLFHHRKIPYYFIRTSNVVKNGRATVMIDIEECKW